MAPRRVPWGVGWAGFQWVSKHGGAFNPTASWRENMMMTHIFFSGSLFSDKCTCFFQTIPNQLKICWNVPSEQKHSLNLHVLPLCIGWAQCVFSVTISRWATDLCGRVYICWLVVWNIFYFSIYWEESSQLTHIVQRGRYTTNQYRFAPNMEPTWPYWMMGWWPSPP